MIIVSLNNGIKMKVKKSWDEFKPMMKAMKMEKVASNIVMDGKMIVNYKRGKRAA